MLKQMPLNRKKGLTIGTIFLLLCSAVAGLGWIGNIAQGAYVWHYSYIFIWEDGTFEPTSAPIQRVSDELYILTNDVYGGISFQRSNAVIEGNGHRIFGNWGTGLFLNNVTDVVVRNLKILYFDQGIYMENCKNVLLKNNTLFDCGITLTQNSTNNNIIDNNTTRIISVEFSSNNTITGNIAGGVSVDWSTNVTIGNNIFSDLKLANATSISGGYTEGISLDNSNNSYVYNNIIERKGLGINIWYSNNLTFRNNVLRDNQFGFKLEGNSLQSYLHNIDTSNTVNGKAVYFLTNRTDYDVPNTSGWIAAINCKNINIQSWTATPNWDGILFAYTTDSKIISSNLKNNFNAIKLDNASRCLISQNTLADNQYAAFYFSNTTECTITQNDVLNNFCFFNIWHNSANNTFYHNNFVGNWTGTIDKEQTNKWDNGYEGNYWNIYTGVDLDRNGISDSPFLIDSFSREKDNYPKVTPYRDMVKPPTSEYPDAVLAMPEETINYTITSIDGVLWAKIDGFYPMHMTSGLGESLPMVYPIPPNTINVRVKLNGIELSVKNYSEISSTALHYTDIGMWSMIYCLIDPVSEDFLLEIHYEHPIEIINGNYTFLYDLNISPYLSSTSINSVAHFNVRLENKSSNVNVFSTGYQGKWSILGDINVKEETSAKIVTFDIISEYGKPRIGDIAFVITDRIIPEFQPWILMPCLIAITAVILILRNPLGKKPAKA